MPEPYRGREAVSLPIALDLLDSELAKAFDNLQFRIQFIRHTISSDTQTAGRISSKDMQATVLETFLATQASQESVQGSNGAVLYRSEKSEAAVVRKVSSQVKKPEGFRLHPQWQKLERENNDAIGVDDTRTGDSILKRTFTTLQGDLTVSAAGARKRLPVIHPHSCPKIVWDVISLCLILLDAFTLPLLLAWDIQPSMRNFPNLLLVVNLWLSLAFWSCDVVLNFNTGFYRGGKLVLNRRQIAFQYATSWLLFDVGILLVDLVTATRLGEEEGDASTNSAVYVRTLRTARYLRNLRTLRLLRLAKAGKLTAVIEHASLSTGVQWLILAFAIMKIGFVMLLVAHVLACSWFLIGRLLEESGYPSWIVLANVRGIQGSTQYIHSLQWVLTPPAPAPLSPESGLERFFCSAMVVITVVVIGSALSMFNDKMHEIRTINTERTKRRRQVRQYLHAVGAPRELTMRIMHFADYKLERHSPVHFDASLISPLLHAELMVDQRGHLLSQHPIFSLTSTTHPGTFARICSALEKRVYGKLELVFSAGFLADGMTITKHGVLTLMEYKDSTRRAMEDCFTNEIRHFEELALYAYSIIHKTTLRVDAFAECLHLTGKDLCAALSNSPACASMFCDYAKELLTVHQQATLKDDDVSDLQCSEMACKVNAVYMDLHPDPGMDLYTIDLRSNLALLRAENTSETGETKMDNELSFVQRVFKDDLPKQKILGLLQEAFVELDPRFGLHAVFAQPKEYEQAISSCLSLVALVQNKFDDFTEPQSQRARLECDQWQQLQDILAWTLPSEEKLQAGLFLLAVRSLGKCRELVKQLPPSCQRPEPAVLYIIKNFQRAAPSVHSLSENSLALVEGALQLHQYFNFPQMLQGENVPASILQLQQLVASMHMGDDVFRFYVFFLLGFMSGLAAGHGSRFLTATNGRSVILGISMLQRVLNSEPHSIYWGFISERAGQLKQRAKSTSDLALFRLACLLRVQNEEGYSQLRDSWDRLSEKTRKILVQHFLAGGIKDLAIVFEFLPLCLESANKNEHVGVPLLLAVLVELLDKLSPLEALPVFHGKLIVVDLSDLASFTQTVQNRLVFHTCISKCKLQYAHCRVYVQMTAENWSRTTEPDSDLAVLAQGIQELEHRQNLIHAAGQHIHNVNHQQSEAGGHTAGRAAQNDHGEKSRDRSAAAIAVPDVATQEVAHEKPHELHQAHF
eukprot:TRINITY_DN23540_c0_g1_i1.p1 TRINITY_DN23540_c0_g1~~TRINITY_DN23540_c0_g1_i1.p1  ORF type:complete len:1211 (-),score=186.87 TRINITY_DN23540_c0_g1_i1:179-3784(-)